VARRLLVEHVGQLVVQRPREVDALDLGEPSEQLAQRRILRGRRLDAQLDVERRAGRHVARAAADLRAARLEQEAAGRDADGDREGADGTDDDDAPGRHGG
jgi:hypothetical protein